MQYMNGRWVGGDTAGTPENVSINGYADDTLREAADIHLADLLGSNRDKHECFCEEFCRCFCPLFCSDFCSDVRDDICVKKHKKRCGQKGVIQSEKKAAVVASQNHCCPQEGCHEIACRACKKVFCDMGIQCPGNFCRCFADEFCRVFCREFECVRRRLCECHHGRKAICCEGCREICFRVCPCVCRKLRCLLDFN